jgi:uncharacterized protein YllA (UPF0747 family)
VETSEALGVSLPTREALAGLRDGSTRAIVTGQQPGVAGGPLLSLYKAATAVELARVVESRWGTRCVPVFWLGSDDDDFAEVRELAVVAKDLSLVSARLDASAHAPGRWVGGIARGEVERAVSAVVPFVPSAGAFSPRDLFERAGADLGAVAARALTELTEGEIVVVDGREPELRRAARDVILAYFDREDEIRAGVRAEGESLDAEGYHAQLELGADSGIFYVRDGTRQRVPADARARARSDFARDVTLASPGVSARSLVQDAVFAPVAAVLGPAEIAYRAQLVRAYGALSIAAPVSYPRLGATFLPPEIRDAAAASGVDVSLLATEPEGWVAAVKRSFRSEQAAHAARRFEAAFSEEATRFVDAAAQRIDARAKEKLEKRIADVARRVGALAGEAVEQDALAAASRWPWLARASELFARAGDPQERFLSLWVPYTFHGRDAWRAVREVASDHVRDALDGRVEHRVYSL